MVSKRNYFSIIIMMAVMFFLFQFTQIVKEHGNRYDINEFAYAQGVLPSGAEQWQPKQEDTEDYILFLGEETTAVGDIVAQWCNYTKKVMVTTDLCDSLKPDKLPKLILLDARETQAGKNMDLVQNLLEWGVPVVFLNIPTASEVEASFALQQILGIREVRAIETKVQGIQLFSGFLLGGEARYEAVTEKEAERQDMDLNVPWYIMGDGTKTYMTGIMDTAEVKNEEFPGLIWRNTYEGTKVFAVCGEYMSTFAGFGILDAISYELNLYAIYPVVNAQNVVIANFPGFSNENAEELMEIYSRNPQMVFKDIMWPSISAMVKTNDLKLTCLFHPQYNYQDGLEPVTEDVVFYLKQLKEMGSEAGMSLTYDDNSEFSQMLEKDTAFYEKVGNDYRYQAVFVEEKDLESFLVNVEEASLLKNVKTVTGPYNEANPLLAYLTDTMTYQSATGDAKEYTYMNHFTARSILTALGYSNVILDLQDAVWPQDTEDQWQHLYDTMSSNIHTYWSGDSVFEQTTLSESDMRIRTFLNLDYTEERTKDTIVLEVSGVAQPAWFILRTHDEKIVGMTGGEYKKLEKNAYLIKADTSRVEIHLEMLSLEEQHEK